MIKRRLQPAGRHRSKPHPGKSCNTNCAPRPGTPFTKCARPSSNRSSARSRNNEASAASACADWRRCAPNGSWCAQPPTCSSSSAPVGHRKQPEMRRRILFGSPRWPTWQTRSKRSGGPCTPTKDLNRAPKIAIPDNLLGNLQQFYVAIPPPVHHVKITGRVAENEQIPVAKLDLFDRLLDGKRLESKRFAALYDVRLNHRSAAREGVDRDGGASLGFAATAGRLLLFAIRLGGACLGP